MTQRDRMGAMRGKTVLRWATDPNPRGAVAERDGRIGALYPQLRTRRFACVNALTGERPDRRKSVNTSSTPLKSGRFDGWLPFVPCNEPLTSEGLLPNTPYAGRGS